MPEHVPITRRLPLSVLAAVVVLGLLPGMASAATVKKQDAVTFIAANGELNDVVVTLEGDAIKIRDANVPIADATGCERIDDRTVRCVAEDFSDATFDLGDGDDAILAPPVVTVDGGTGNDRITGGELTYAKHNRVVVDLDEGTGGGTDEKDTLTGITSVTGSDGDDLLYGNGADNVIDGGTGEDEIEGRGGNDDLTGDGIDYFSGGSGDDVIRSGDKSADAVYCGSGHDSVGSPPRGLADRIDNLSPDCERVLVLGLGTVVARPTISRGALVFTSVGQSCRCALSTAVLDPTTGRRIGAARVKRAGRTLRIPLNLRGRRLIRGRGDERQLRLNVKRGRSVGGYGVALPPR